jgi:Protein of unknown function (DUF3667)
MSVVRSEPTTAVETVPPAPTACANCGASVSGEYCSTCGQRMEQSMHSLTFFLGEALEDLTHADSRLWRTLISLFARPGFLTVEFLRGRRARYLPPVRLYLVLSVAFFLLASLTPSVGVLVVSTDNDGNRTSVKSESLNQALNGLSKPNETPEQRAERICASPDATDFLTRYLSLEQRQSMCRRVLFDSGASLSAAVVHNVPRALFVFLPLIALVMKLLYRHPRRYYVEHLLFLLNNHSFVFLLFGLFLLARYLPLGSVRAALFPLAMLYCLWYLYRAMRRVYGQSPLLTVVKYGALALTYVVSAFMMLGLTTLYSLFTLARSP